MVSKPESAIAIPDGFPLNPGHTLVVPRQHVADFFALSPEEQADIWRLVAAVRAAPADRRAAALAALLAATTASAAQPRTPTETASAFFDALHRFDAEAAAALQLQDKILRTFPEVERVFGKAGRAETSNMPMTPLGREEAFSR